MSRTGVWRTTRTTGNNDKFVSLSLLNLIHFFLFCLNDSSEHPSLVNGVEELVDVMEDDGRRVNIQNMLSSIVYSQGLTEEEVRHAIDRWHCRVVIPPLDASDFRYEWVWLGCGFMACTFYLWFPK